jgi:hypothetical protein
MLDKAERSPSGKVDPRCCGSGLLVWTRSGKSFRTIDW